MMNGNITMIWHPDLVTVGLLHGHWLDDWIVAYQQVRAVEDRMISAIVTYGPYVFIGICAFALPYIFRTHIDDVPQPDDDCPFWTGDPP